MQTTAQVSCITVDNDTNRLRIETGSIDTYFIDVIELQPQNENMRQLFLAINETVKKFWRDDG